MESLLVKLSRKNVAKMIVTFSKIKREQAYFTWQQEAQNSKEKKLIKKEVDEKRLMALRKIMRRNYLKLFVEICQRKLIYEAVATRLACNSQINPQKALWRLLLNARNSN